MGKFYKTAANRFVVREMEFEFLEYECIAVKSRTTGNKPRKYRAMYFDIQCKGEMVLNAVEFFWAPRDQQVFYLKENLKWKLN